MIQSFKKISNNIKISTNLSSLDDLVQIINDRDTLYESSTPACDVKLVMNGQEFNDLFQDVVLFKIDNIDLFYDQSSLAMFLFSNENKLKSIKITRVLIPNDSEQTITLNSSDTYATEKIEYSYPSCYVCDIMSKHNITHINNLVEILNSGVFIQTYHDIVGVEYKAKRQLWNNCRKDNNIMSGLEFNKLTAGKVLISFIYNENHKACFNWNERRQPISDNIITTLEFSKYVLDLYKATHVKIVRIPDDATVKLLSNTCVEASSFTSSNELELCNTFENVFGLNPYNPTLLYVTKWFSPIYTICEKIYGNKENCDKFVTLFKN